VERCVVTGSLFALGPGADEAPRDESALAADTHRLAAANDYVRTKTLLSRDLRDRQAAGDPVMQVFPTVLLGPGPRTRGNHLSLVLDDIRRGRHPGLVGDGRQAWNLVGVDDAARGHVLALERGSAGGNWILGGEDWTQERLVREAAERFGVTPPLRRLGSTLPRMLGRLSVLGARVFGIEPAVTPGEVDLLDAHWAFSSARARDELGYAPRPVAEVLDETVAWLTSEEWAR
jgi:dihydroflavonol-4-reductase